jgi:hypothetical protein
MKKLIYTAIGFMFMLIFIGCFATMTPEERKEKYDLRKEVGYNPFVGDIQGSDAFSMMQTGWW